MRCPSVVITGASSGIGAATALALAGRGWRVFAGVRRPEDGEALAARAVAEAGTGSGTVAPIPLDVTDSEEIENAVETVRTEAGDERLDGLVNNAGWLCLGPMELVPPEDVRQQMDVNVIGVWSVTRAFLPALRAARGRIVHVSSISGRSAMPFMGAYAASKFALEAMADSMRVELRRFGIRVSLIEPGSIHTALLDKNLARLDHIERSLTEEERQLYGADLVAMRSVVRSSHARALPVERVVRLIVHALTARRPKTRYRLGSGAAMLELLEKLPTTLRDGLLAAFLRRYRSRAAEPGPD